MARTVAIGIQNFEKYIESKCFYVDKTKFIGEWWKASDDTTVVMRPRRFGKTLTMDMVKTFFSLEYKDKGEKIFGGLEIWQDEEMKALQGTYPVIFLTFAAVSVFCISIAIVIGPTPPGTGVIASQIGATES